MPATLYNASQRLTTLYNASQRFSPLLSSHMYKLLHASKALQGLESSPVMLSASQQLRDAVIKVLHQWLTLWQNDRQVASFLNHTRFQEEVEEALVPIGEVIEYLASARASHTHHTCAEPEQHQVTGDVQHKYSVFDLCAGKGFVSMLLAWVARFIPLLHANIHEVVMVDKATTIKLHHIDASNAITAAATADTDGDGDGAGSSDRLPLPIRCVQTDLHDTYLLTNLGMQPHTRAIIIGIHMCRRLAPRCLQIYSQAASNFDCVVLSPCCVPPPGPPIHLNGLVHEYQAGEQTQNYERWVGWLFQATQALEQGTSQTVAPSSSTTTTTTAATSKHFTAPLKGGKHRCNAFIVATRDAKRTRQVADRLMFATPDASTTCLQYWHHGRCKRGDACKFEHVRGGIRSCAEAGSIARRR
jgi:hypothetical protein